MLRKPLLRCVQARPSAASVVFGKHPSNVLNLIYDMIVYKTCS